jgi:1,4-dihydroxy-6-naphthoate synthase
MLIHLAHSPDADDAFMFYALAAQKISFRGFQFKHILSDIETLNKLAFEGKYEVTALSLHAFAYVMDKYTLLPNGASIGRGYGPIVVAREKIPLESLKDILVAVPGKFTTATLVLNLAIGKHPEIIMNFDEIMEAVASRKVEAGLLIHEGQLTHRERGLVKILDLGEWWEKETGLPLPLGVDAYRTDLGEKNGRLLAEIFEESIRYALAHEDEALDYALQFGRGIEQEKARQFVRMYVNERTLCFSEAEKKSIFTLLEEGHRKGFLPFKPDLNKLFAYS